MRRSLVFFVVVLILADTPARAGICIDLAARAERAFGIPRYTLQSIVMTESGDNPNALNLDGRAVLPQTRYEARHVIKTQRPLVRNMDVGCAQISLRHHPKYFARQPELALDPWFNVVYASKYLLEQKQRFGNWTRAVAYYHSDDSTRQGVYVCKVARHFNRLAGLGAGLGSCDVGRQGREKRLQSSVEGKR